MTLLLLALAAGAGPHQGPWRIDREHRARLGAEDQIQGLAPSPLADALQWRADPVYLAEADLVGRDWDDPGVVLRPLARLSEGDQVPVLRDGDAEPGQVSARLGADVRAATGLVEARALLWAGADLGPGSVTLRPEQLRLGLRTAGFWLALAQESRWLGPARRGSLVHSDNGRPLPGVDLGGTWRLPGKADVLGRFALTSAVGWIPEARRGPDRPGWLLVDLRWQPLPQVELGASRRALFGGSEDGVRRPVDALQLLLPTEPHVEDDPDRLQHDSDECAALDARVTVPVGRWVDQPVDYVEFWVQHGGEDVVRRDLGPIPWASLAGVANVYGGEVVAGPAYLGAEVAVVEDDLFRWYTGHRLYHDGWTLDGRVLGHPRGGDARSWTLWAGWLHERGWAEASLERSHRVEVADVVQGVVFVLPEAEVGHRATLRAAWLLEDQGALSLEVGGGPVRGRGFVPGSTAFEHRIALAWSGPALSW